MAAPAHVLQLMMVQEQMQRVTSHSGPATPVSEAIHSHGYLGTFVPCRFSVVISVAENCH